MSKEINWMEAKVIEIRITPFGSVVAWDIPLSASQAKTEICQRGKCPNPLLISKVITLSFSKIDRKLYLCPDCAIKYIREVATRGFFRLASPTGKMVDYVSRSEVYAQIYPFKDEHSIDEVIERFERFTVCGNLE